MTIRKMCGSDIPAVSEIEKDNFRPAWSADEFRKSMENPIYSFFVAEENGQVLGYAGMYTVLDESDVANIAVDACARQKGFGRALLNALIEESMRRKAAGIFLEVRESNEPAIRMYESSGFEQVGLRKNFYEFPRENARLYKKELQENTDA